MKIKFHFFIANSTQVSKVALYARGGKFGGTQGCSAGGDTLMHVSAGVGELARRDT